MKDSLPEHWFQILLSLAGQDLHGLAITAEVLERTEGRVHLWPGMLYGALKQMTARGYVTEAVQLAEVYDPQGALAAGFLDEVVDPDDVEARAVERATTWAADLEPKAFARTRQIARGDLHTEIRETSRNR